MQKSADIASVATRLNNLEQKFEEIEIPDPGEPDRALVDMLFKMTASGSEIPGSLDSDWAKNSYFFGTSMSIATSLYGIGHFNEDIYGYVSQVPFYHRVFGNSDKFGRPNTGPSNPGTPSLANAVFGFTGSFDDAFTTDVGSSGSVCHVVFGGSSAVEYLRGRTYDGSLFSIVLGSPSTVDDDLIEIIGGTNYSILEILKRMKNDHDTLKNRVSDLESYVSSLEGRIYALEHR